jgi:hypothetical protein
MPAFAVLHGVLRSTAIVLAQPVTGATDRTRHRASAVALVACQPAEHGQRRIGSVADLQSTCLSVTHITNGCFRLHPIQWNVGEAAGAVAAYAANERSTPHAIQISQSSPNASDGSRTSVSPCPGRTDPNRRPPWRTAGSGRRHQSSMTPVRTRRGTSSTAPTTRAAALPVQDVPQV